MESSKILPTYDPKKIKSLKAFNAIAVKDTQGAVDLAMTYPHVAQLLTYEYFLKQTEREFDYACKLAQVPYLSELVDTENKFLEICKYSFEVAMALLVHPKIYEMAVPIKHLMLHAFYNLDEPRVKEARLASHHLAALDLAKGRRIHKKEKEDNDTNAHEASVFERMTLDEVNRKKMAEIALRQFPTINRYFESMMFGPSGYYTTGKVDFGNHFSTFASNPNEVAGFSAAFAYQLFTLRNKLIQEGKLKPTDAFNVVEFGGGNGDLCFNILETILKMAYQDEEWKNFYRCIHYHLVDISPKLIERQKERIKKFAKNVDVIPGDARKFVPGLKGKKIAAVLGNELLDMFAPQDIFINEEGNIVVGVMIPCISNYRNNRHFKRVLKESGLSLKELEVHSNHYKSVFLMLYPSDDKEKKEQDIKNLLFLSEKSFLKLHKIVAKKKEYPDVFGFITLRSIDVNLVPKLADFIKRNPEFVERMKRGNIRNPQIEIRDFLENVENMLIPGGEVLLVDYGDHDHINLDGLRTYSTEGRGFSPTKEPGFRDITVSTNFSTVHKEGENLGFEGVFYGSQAQLCVDYFPDEVLSFQSRLIFQMASQKHTDFHVMVQRKPDKAESCEKEKGKEKEKEKDKTTANTVPRFVGDSQPVGYGELFAEMQRKTRQMGATQGFAIEKSKSKETTPLAFASLFGTTNEGSLLGSVSLNTISLKVHKSLLEDAKKICGDRKEFAPYLSAIEEQNYAKALRIACEGCLIKHVMILLAYSDMLSFDINEPKDTGETALDLLETASIPKVQLPLKEKLKEKLLECGARNRTISSSKGAC